MKLSKLILLSLIFFISISYASTFTDNNQTSFDQGNYSYSIWNGSEIILNNKLIGEYTSKVFDANKTANWTNITINFRSPTLEYIFILDNDADIWRSLDGITWTLVKDDYNSGENNNEIWLTKDYNNTLYIVEDDNDVWKSFNAGVNWSKVKTDYNGAEGQSPILMISDKNSSLFIVEGDEDIWKSSDYGINWNKINGSDFNGANGDIIGISVDSSNNIYIVDNDADIWKSSNSGITWTLTKDNYNAGEANSLNDMTIDSNNSLFIVEGDDDIWKSSDAITWTKVKVDYNGEGQHADYITSNKNNILFITESDEDVWRSTDSATNWTKINSTDFNGANGDVRYVAIPFYTTNITYQVRSDDDNASWVSFTGPTSQSYYYSSSTLNISPGRYFQYKVNFSTMIGNITPSIYNITIGYELDNQAPIYSSETNYSNTFTFNANRNYQFNITVSDNIEVNKVILQLDNTNYTTYRNNNFYTFNISGLSAGNHIYKWFMNDTSNNVNTTNSLTLTIQKDSPTISLYLNNSENSITINTNTTLNITTQLNIQDTISLYINKTLNTTKLTPIEVFNLFNQSGLYNITTVYLGNQNYTYKSKEFFVNVSDVIPPNNPPNYYNTTNYSSNFVFDPSKNYEFNITVLDDIQVNTVLLQLNNQNYTSTNIGNNIYTFNIIGLSAGNYNYKWFMNDSYSATNTTPEFTFSIIKANSNVSLYLNGTQNNITIEVNSTLNITGLLNNGEGNILLYVAGILNKSSSSPLTHLKTFEDIDNYNISLLYLGNQNYSFSSQEFFVNVIDSNSIQSQGSSGSSPSSSEPSSLNSGFEKGRESEDIQGPRTRQSNTQSPQTPSSPAPQQGVTIEGTPIEGESPAGASILGAFAGVAKTPSFITILITLLIVVTAFIFRNKLKRSFKNEKNTRLKNTELHNYFNELGFKVKKREDHMQVLQTEMKDNIIEKQENPPQALSPVEKMKSSINKLKTHFPETIKEVKEKRHLLRKPHEIEVKRISHSGNVFTADELAKQFPETFGKLNPKKIKQRVFFEPKLKVEKKDVKEGLKELGFEVKEKSQIQEVVQQKTTLQPEKKIEKPNKITDIKSQMLKNMKEAFENE